MKHSCFCITNLITKMKRRPRQGRKWKCFSGYGNKNGSPYGGSEHTAMQSEFVLKTSMDDSTNN